MIHSAIRQALALARFPSDADVAECASAALANLSATAWWSGAPPLLRATLLRFPHNQHVTLAAMAGLRAMDAQAKEARPPLWRRLLAGVAASVAPPPPPAGLLEAGRPVALTPLPLSVAAPLF